MIFLSAGLAMAVNFYFLAAYPKFSGVWHWKARVLDLGVSEAFFEIITTLRILGPFCWLIQRSNREFKLETTTEQNLGRMYECGGNTF
jgi:hypothetical protein